MGVRNSANHSSFGGELEPRIEEAFRKSEPGKWLFRTADFEERPIRAARSYFLGGMFGPIVSPYEHADHLFWLLSSASLWLPSRVRMTLLKGMKEWNTWLWGGGYVGTLSGALYSAIGSQRFIWTRKMEAEVRARIRKAITDLSLPDSENQIIGRFREEKFPESFLEMERQRLKQQPSNKR